MRVDDNDDRDGSFRLRDSASDDGVRTPPLSPVTAAVTPRSAHMADAVPPASPQFWCHECAVNVETRIDGTTDEVCCQCCGGNFVEEVEADDPPEEFQREVQNEPATAAAPPSTGSAAASIADDEVNEERDFFERYISEIRGELAGGNRASTSPSVEGDQAAFAGGRRRIQRQMTGAGAFSDSLLQLLGGGGAGGATGAGGSSARTARIISTDGTPLEVFIGSSTLGSTGSGGSDAGGLFGALGGILNAPFGGLASNPGDYAFGNLSTIINQLMQNDPNRHGAPPAAKDVVEQLPKIKITQSDVDASAECPVCKDLFAVDEDSHKLPCAHAFHIDCILPWLKQHNSCPVCRHELPTDDPDYERRRRASVSE